MTLSIADRLSKDAQSWRPIDSTEYPDHPNPLVGEVVETETGDGDYGEYPILTLLDDDGNEWRWSVFGGVAQGRIAKLNPQVGDTLGVKYLGEKPAKNFPNRTYHDWRIVIERGSNPAPVAAPATASDSPVESEKPTEDFEDEEF